MAEKEKLKQPQSLDALFETLFNAVLEGAFVLDFEGRVIRANDAFLRMVGIGEDETIGAKPPYPWWPPEREKEYRKIVQESLGGNRAPIEIELVRGDGTRFEAEVIPAAVNKSPEGEHYVVGLMRDITEQKRAQRSIELSEERFSKVFMASPAAMGLTDLETGKIAHVNDRALEVFGCSREALVGYSAEELGLWENPDQRRELIDRLKRGDAVRDVSVKFRRPDGDLRDILLSLEFIRTSERKYLLLMATDVSEKVRSEVAQKRLVGELRERVKELTAIHRISQLLQDARAVNDELLQKLVEILQEAWQFPEITAVRVRCEGVEAVTPDFRETKWRLMTTLFGDKPERGCVEIFYLEERPEETEGPFLKEEVDLLRTVASQLASFTERVCREREFRISEERLQMALKGADLGLWDWNLVTDEVTFSERAREIVRATRLQLQAGDAFAGVEAKDVGRVREDWERHRQGETPMFMTEFRVPRENGEPLWIRCRGGIVQRAADGTPLRASGTYKDITQGKRAEKEREELETKLRQAQKLEAVGQMAGGIAHDFNNMLTPIIGYAEILGEELDAMPAAKECVEQILSAAERTKNLTAHLLAFSRKQVLEFKQVNLTAEVDALLKMLRRLIREDISIERELDPELPSIRADAMGVQQVILNLAVNARDAMQDGGIIRIGTSVESFSKPRTCVDGQIAPGEYVRLRVEDTGSGMDPETLRHAFDPFFTTKQEGQGTGLGLATVYGVVKQHEGYICVTSEPLKGTTFDVYFPRVEVEEPKAPPEAVATSGHSGGETILIVEDEEYVRKLTREVLQRQGYLTLDTGDTDEALRIAAEPDREIDLLLTDVIMPKMNGRQLSEALAKNQPKMKVVYMSGYADDVLARQGMGEGEVQFLQKPFSMADLTKAIRGAIRENNG